ncbi:MAG TPA: AraC family transcriptional regulator [Thermoanaerobaculia bacterium]|nr:AraC family transcriptional regulator [Thermoanaerobaculia bacterium]
MPFTLRTMSSQVASDPRLPFGQFFGREQSSLDVRGFALAHLSPTVPEREVVRHTHEEAHFVLVTSGVYVTSARDAPDLCTAPTLIYNPPGTTHRDCFRSQSGRFFTISVSAPALDHAASCAPLPDAAGVLPRHLLALGRRVARECLSPDGTSPLIAEALCLELLARTSQSFDREQPPAPGWLRCARELLHDACDEEMSISGISESVGVHPVHLTRTFRRFFGCTPGEYLRERRLEKAAALLAEGKMPLSEVALASGFADQSHLAKAFKRAYRVTPSEYRRRLH